MTEGLRGTWPSCDGSGFRFEWYGLRMQSRRVLVFTVLLLLSAAAVLADTATLQVTYYYLPG